MQEAEVRSRLQGLHEAPKPTPLLRKQHRHYPSSDLATEINLLNKLRSKWPSPSKGPNFRKSSAKNLPELPPEEPTPKPHHKKSNSQSSTNFFLYAQEVEAKGGLGKGLADKTARRGSHKRTFSGVKGSSMKFSGILGLQFLQKSNMSQRLVNQQGVSSVAGLHLRPQRRTQDTSALVVSSHTGAPALKNSRVFKKGDPTGEIRTNTINKVSSAKIGKGILTNFGSDFFRRLKDLKSQAPVRLRPPSKPTIEPRPLTKKQSKSRIFTKLGSYQLPAPFVCFRKATKDTLPSHPPGPSLKPTLTPVRKIDSLALYREIARPLQLNISKKLPKETRLVAESQSNSAAKRGVETDLKGSEFKKKQPVDEASDPPESTNNSPAYNLQVSEIYQPSEGPSEPVSAQKSVRLPTEAKAPNPPLPKGRHTKNVQSLPQNNISEMVRRLRIPINFVQKAKHCSMTPDASIHASPRDEHSNHELEVHINEESKESPSGGSSVGVLTPIVPIASPEAGLTSLQLSPRGTVAEVGGTPQPLHNIAIAEPEDDSRTNSVHEGDRGPLSNQFALPSHSVSHSSPVDIPSTEGLSRHGTPQHPPSPERQSLQSPTHHFQVERPDFTSTRDDLNRKVLIDKVRGYRSLTGKVLETTLEFYTLSKMIGEGSYGKVYLGHSVLCGKAVAMKCYDKSKIRAKSTTDRILQEVDILSNLDHDGIIRMFEIFENKKFIFMVLEYVDCGDLLSWMRDHGKFSEAAFLPILHQILEGLAYLHSRGILHRDVKLDNILLGSDGRIRLCDFGVSKKMPSKGLVFEHIGTPAYIAPEIVVEKGYSGFKADVWSLGITCFIAMTGHIPFKGNDIGQLQNNILSNDLQFPRDCKLSDRMRGVIAGMLEKNPRRRLGIAEVAAALELPLNLQSEFRQRTLDKQKIEIVKSLGFDESVLVAALSSNLVNHGTALYKML